MTHKRLNQIRLDIETSVVGSSQFSRSLDELHTLWQKGDVEAGIYLSWLYAQTGALKGFAKKSFALCEEIFNKTGHPGALDRMADLYLWGVGIPRNEAASFRIYRQMVHEGTAPFHLLAFLYSHGIGTELDEALAASWLLLSAIQGETLAFILLSNRYANGLGVPINGLLARAFAHLAALRGFPGSTKHEHNLAKQFPSVTRNQVEAMISQLKSAINSFSDEVDKLIRHIHPASQEFPELFRQLAITTLEDVGVSDLSFDTSRRGFEYNSKTSKREKSWELVSRGPRVVKMKNFADFEECQYLINQSMPLLQPTTLQLKANVGREVDAFSGESAVLVAGQPSPVYRVIQKRFADLLGVPLENFEPLSILKYAKGHDYQLHTDAFEEDRIARHKARGDFGGQRVTTNLLYLLSPEKGGGTWYQSIEQVVKGEMGTAIVHSNCTADFKADPRGMHAGQAVLQGEKWLLRTATRRFPLYATNRF